MRKFVYRFLVFVALYHIIVTYVSFGLWKVPPYGILLLRDASRLWVLFVFALYHRGTINRYLAQWWTVWLRFFVLLISSIFTSIALWVDVVHVMVWIKYSLYYIIPFLTSLFIWTVRASHYNESHIKKRIQKIWILFIGILIIGWVWQILKNIFPDIMYTFWYGDLGDYIYGKNPPLYYLTWPHGIQRWSWIFSWPNNYWYLLVAFFGLFWYWMRAYVKNFSSKIVLWSLYIITLSATLSRWAILWVLIQVVLIAYVIYYSQRKVILLATIAWLAAVVGLSVLKWQSTLAHVKAKFMSLHYVQQSPLGYWLWSSWPSVHSQGWYLPENFFVQLMMDLWIHWFVLRACFWILIFLIVRRIYFQKPSSRTLLFFVSVWFVWLMLEWLFLHVLEDSMVNYMYFIVWGILLGYIASEEKLFKSIDNR